MCSASLVVKQVGIIDKEAGVIEMGNKEQKKEMVVLRERM